MQHRSGFEGRSPPLHATRINRLVFFIFFPRKKGTEGFPTVSNFETRVKFWNSCARSRAAHSSAVSVRSFSRRSAPFRKRGKNESRAVSCSRLPRRDDLQLSIFPFPDPRVTTTPSNVDRQRRPKNTITPAASCCEHELLFARQRRKHQAFNRERFNRALRSHFTIRTAAHAHMYTPTRDFANPRGTSSGRFQNRRDDRANFRKPGETAVRAVWLTCSFVCTRRFSFFLSTEFYVPTTRRLNRRDTRWPHRFGEQNEHSRSVDDRRVQRGASFASGRRLLHKIPRSAVGGRSRGSLLPLIVVGDAGWTTFVTRDGNYSGPRYFGIRLFLIAIVLLLCLYAVTLPNFTSTVQAFSMQRTARLATDSANFPRHLKQSPLFYRDER